MVVNVKRNRRWFGTNIYQLQVTSACSPSFSARATQFHEDTEENREHSTTIIYIYIYIHGLQYWYNVI